MNNYQYAIKEPLSKRLYSPVQQTGFRYREVEGNCSFIIGSKNYNHILFLLEGGVTISCNEFSKKIINTDDFILIPIAADVTCTTNSSCRILVFSFDLLPESFDRVYLQSLSIICASSPYQFKPFTINESLNRFITLLSLYFEKGLNKPILHEIKSKEFFVILQSFYTKKEVASILHPIIGYSSEFRTRILRKYREINNIEDLAKIFNIDKRTFTRQFKEEFKMSPYQWLLNQKAKHVHFSLADTSRSLENIRQEHGFKYAAHFTRFCREQFNCSPVKLRKQIANG